MFKTNPNLRGHNEPVPVSKEQAQEIVRCSQDISYFANNYFYITTIDYGKITIPLRKYQYKILKSFVDGNTIDVAEGGDGKKNRIVLSGRQTGKTTTVSIYVLWLILFKKDSTIAILGNKMATAMEIMQRIRESYEDLPIWMQPGLLEWNKTSFETSYHMKIFCSSTSASGIRGKAIGYLVCDEIAFVPKNIINDFMSSVLPTVSSGKKSQVILVSTPNGTNHYYDMWRDAKIGKSSYKPIKVNWWDVPGRDLAWKEQTIADIGLVKFNQEYSCVDGESLIDIKCKKTGDIITIPIEEFYEFYAGEDNNV